MIGEKLLRPENVWQQELPYRKVIYYGKIYRILTMYSHKVNEILMDPGIIRHLRVKCQPDLILILGCYDVSVYFGQNNHIMSLIFMFLIC